MEKVKTPEFRVSFPNVFVPKSFQGQDPKYNIVMLFDKTQDLTTLKNMVVKAIEDKWPDKNKRPSNLRSPFRDGDIDKPDVAGYEGKIFVSASSKIKPGVVDQNLQPIMSEDEFYAGCYARASLTVYAYDTAGNRGVAFGLQNLQKTKEGEAFTGRTKAEDDFEVINISKPEGMKQAVNQSSFDAMFA